MENELIVDSDNSPALMGIESSSNKKKNFHWKKILLILLFSALVIISFCIIFAPSREERKRMVIDELTQMSTNRDRANYYVENRDRYDFLDTIYHDLFADKIFGENFPEFRDICSIIKSTPNANYVIKHPKTQDILWNKLSNISTAQGGADFYVDNRSLFYTLDKLYLDSIVPIVLMCDFLDISRVYKTVANTTVQCEMQPYYEARKAEFMNEVEDDLNFRRHLYMDDFEIIMEFAKLEIIRCFVDDIKKITEEYSGGVGGWVSSFFNSRTPEDFKTEWEKQINNVKYADVVKSFGLTGFVDKINTYNRCYISKKTGKNCSTNTFTFVEPSFSLPFVLNKERAEFIKVYNESKRNGAWWDGINTIAENIPTYGQFYSWGKCIGEMYTDMVHGATDEREYENMEELLQDYFVMDVHDVFVSFQNDVENDFEKKIIEANRLVYNLIYEEL